MILHALGAAPEAWYEFTVRLGETYRVFTPKAQQRASFEELRDDLAAYADGLGLSRFHLMGHSMGGTTAWLYATEHKKRVDRLVLVECPILRPSPDFPIRLAGGAVIEPDPGWPALVARIRCPTLVVRSIHSPLRDRTAELSTLIAGARLASLDGGHHLQTDNLDALLAEVEPFLSGQ